MDIEQLCCNNHFVREILNNMIKHLLTCSQLGPLKRLSLSVVFIWRDTVIIISLSIGVLHKIQFRLFLCILSNGTMATVLITFNTKVSRLCISILSVQ